MQVTTLTGRDYFAERKAQRDKVKRATKRREESEQAWREAIREAYAAGCSLRTIAEVAGVAHTRVLQIVRET